MGPMIPEEMKYNLHYGDECFNGEQMLGWDFAHMPDDANPQILHLLERITKTRLFKYTENITTKKIKIIQIKILIFFIFLLKT